jgi:hypothetical protein
MNHPIFDEYKQKAEELARVKAELKQLNERIIELRRDCKHDIERVINEDTNSSPTRQHYVFVCKICGSMTR